MDLRKIFQLAEKNRTAVGHFNVSNLETFEAVVRSGKKSRMPIIVGVSEGAIKHAGIDFLFGQRVI
jgi:fructose-bisphosphate aldolase, class II